MTVPDEAAPPAAATESEAVGGGLPNSRRRSLAFLGMGALALVGAAYVGLRQLFATRERGALPPQVPLELRPIARADSLPAGDWQLVTLESDIDPKRGTKNQKAVFVRRDANRPTQFRVLSARCSHKGCQVTWKRDQKSFVCPCHGGKFDNEGNRVEGPPRGPLLAIEAEVRDGQLFVRF